MRISLGAIRNVAGLLLGFGAGLILMSPTVSALSMVPGLALLSPTNSSNVSGTITFVAAADSDGLVSLQFKVDGNDYGSTITSGSCRTTFDTRSVYDGPHTVQAVGQDEFGNPVFTSPSTIFVNNVAPAISGVSVTNVTTTSATINWTTAAPADGRVDFGETMSYGGSAYDSTIATSHAVTLTGLSAATPYHFAAMSFGQNGILSSSGDFVFSTVSGGVAPPPSPSPTPGTPPTPGAPTPSPTPGVPTPSPTPAPTPHPPTPSPTPSPSPGVPTPSPSPTPVTPIGTPTSPTATPAPGGTHGRNAPTGSENLGSAVPRSDSAQPTQMPSLSGQGTTRGANASTSSVPGASAVSRTSGQSVINVSTVGTGNGGSGTGLTVSMLMPSSWVSGSPNSSTSSTPQKRGAQTSSQTRSTDTPAYTPCAGPNPFVNDGGGMCVNGTWIRMEPDTTNGSTTSVTTSTPPPAAPAATSNLPLPKDFITFGTSASVSNRGKNTASCSTPDPFAAKGGVGICVKGEWVLLWKSSKGK